MTPECVNHEKRALYTAMGHEARAEALGRMLHGYDDDGLKVNDLIDVLKMKHGANVAQAFFDTMSLGFATAGTTFNKSFATASARYERFDVLEQVLSCLDDLKRLERPPEAANASELLDHLSTRTTNAGNRVHYSLYRTGADCATSDAASRIFAFALRHQPRHPDISWALSELPDEGGVSFSPVAASLLREQMMRKQVDSALQGELKAGDSKSLDGARPKRAL